MAFDGEGIAVVLLQPLRLLVQCRARLRREVGRIGLEEDAVAHVHHEILWAARSSRAGHAGDSLVRLAGAARHSEGCDQESCETRAAENTHHHAGASILASLPDLLRFNGCWLNERSINLDEALRRSLKNI